MEIERKFLVKEIPNLDGVPTNYIEQGYLSIEPEIRIRKKNYCHYLTVKGEGTISRTEFEVEINLRTYWDLLKKVIGKVLLKNRYMITLDDGNIAELDIYNNLDDLMVVEVEFDSLEKANNFKIPSWFGIEVTDNKDFKNKNLAKILSE